MSIEDIKAQLDRIETKLDKLLKEEEQEQQGSFASSEEPSSE